MKLTLMKAQTFPSAQNELFFYSQCHSFAFILCGSAEMVGILDTKSEGQFHALAILSGSCYFIKQEPLSVPFM